MPSKKHSVSSKTTLHSIGEYDNEGMSIDDERTNVNDLTIHSKCSHTSILRKPSDWQRSVSMNEGQFYGKL